MSGSGLTGRGAGTKAGAGEGAEAGAKAEGGGGERKEEYAGFEGGARGGAKATARAPARDQFFGPKILRVQRFLPHKFCFGKFETQF